MEVLCLGCSGKVRPDGLHYLEAVLNMNKNGTAMGDVKLEYVDRARQLIREHPASFAALLERLECVRTEYCALHEMPFGVDIVRDGVGRLVCGLGMGNRDWFLMFHPADEETDPVLYSLGDTEKEGMVRYHLGEAGGVSRKYLVARSDALRVLQSWFENGTLSNAVNWTDKIF